MGCLGVGATCNVPACSTKLLCHQNCWGCWLYVRHLCLALCHHHHKHHESYREDIEAFSYLHLLILSIRINTIMIRGYYSADIWYLYPAYQSNIFCLVIIIVTLSTSITIIVISSIRILSIIRVTIKITDQVCAGGQRSHQLLLPLPLCLREGWSTRHFILLRPRRPAGNIICSFVLFSFCLLVCLFVCLFNLFL